MFAPGAARIKGVVPHPGAMPSPMATLAVARPPPVAPRHTVAAAASSGAAGRVASSTTARPTGAGIPAMVSIARTAMGRYRWMFAELLRTSS